MDSPRAEVPEPAEFAEDFFAELENLAVSGAVEVAVQRAVEGSGDSDRFALIDTVASRLAAHCRMDKYHLARDLREGRSVRGLVRLLAMFGLGWADLGGLPKSGDCGDLLARRVIGRIRTELPGNHCDSKRKGVLAVRDHEVLKLVFEQSRWSIRRGLLDDAERLAFFEELTRRPEIAAIDGGLSRRQLAEKLDRIEREWGDAYSTYIQLRTRLREAGFVDLP